MGWREEGGVDHLSSRPVSEPGVKEVPWEGSTLNSARLQGEQSCGGPLPNQTSQPLSFLPALLWNPLLWPGPLACGISLSWSVIWAPVKLKPPGEMLGYHPGLCLRRGALVWEAGRQTAPSAVWGDWAVPQGLRLLCWPYGTVPGTRSKAF